ncbi:Meiotic coiled-coil protein 5, partial [Dissostichus eleginoides]
THLVNMSSRASEQHTLLLTCFLKYNNWRQQSWGSRVPGAVTEATASLSGSNHSIPSCSPTQS